MNPTFGVLEGRTPGGYDYSSSIRNPAARQIAYNQKLSERRANAVRDWLANREGLKNTRFATRGFGAKKPVAPNTTPDGSDDPEGRQKNRKVEIIDKKGQPVKNKLE